jgi:ribosomal protein L32
MKKRHRQYAGKALKDVTALNKCSACGNVKRAHLLCPYCVQGTFFRIVKVACADFNTEIKAMLKSPFAEQGVLQKSLQAKQREHSDENGVSRTTADKSEGGSR